MHETKYLSTMRELLTVHCVSNEHLQEDKWDFVITVF